MDAAAHHSFASLLKAFRLDRGLSQMALAERAGLSRDAIGMLERGLRHSPRRDTVTLLAEALKLSPADRARLRSASEPRRGAIAGTTFRSRIPSSLPPRLTSFIGRETEIADVQELVRSKRLVTLSGPGGIGKTSLALAVAARIQTQFSDGVALVDLAPLADVGLVPNSVAAALGVRERQGEATLAALVRALATDQRLLVLDNCEHLLDGCAQLAEALLRGCPSLRILATSREPLRIGAEVIWRVPTLYLPDDDPQPLDVLARSEAVYLFVERAQAVRSGFALNGENAATVAEICRRLDGMPLAIELAAARVSALTPEQIAHHLNDRFRLLTTGSRTALPRHQTLRALLDWSHALLTEQEQALFRRLAVFAGGWTLEAAEAVGAVPGVGGRGAGDESSSPTPIPGEAVLDRLTGLVDKSLVLVVERDGEARFTMLETIREYARDQLVARGEASDLHFRHASWYLSLAETAQPSVRVMSDENLPVWIMRLEQERDNLRAALGWLREARDVERALRLVGVLWLFWKIRDENAEGRAQIEAVLALPGVSNYPAAWAEARHGAGEMALGLGDLPTARSHFAWVVDYHRGSGDRRGLGDAFLSLGIVAREGGDFARAVPSLEEALAIGRDLGDPRVTGWGLFHLGITKRVQGDPIGARSLLEESLAVFRRDGWTEGVTAQVIGDLGRVAEDLGDDSRAAALYREALRVLGPAKDRMAIASLLEGIARLAAKASQPARALRLIGAASGLREEIGSPVSPVLRGLYERTLELARGQIAPDVADAEAAAGRKMTVQDAVACAMSD